MARQLETGRQDSTSAEVSFAFTTILTQTLKEEIRTIEPQTAVEQHTLDVLQQISTSLEQLPAQMGYHPVIVSTPSDHAREEVVHTLEKAIHAIPEPQRPGILMITETGGNGGYSDQAILYTSWKNLEADIHSRHVGLLLIDQNEPITDGQKTVLSELMRQTSIVACSMGWAADSHTDTVLSLGRAIDSGLLRPIERRPCIARLSDTKTKLWRTDGAFLTKDMAALIARDRSFIESLVNVVYQEVERSPATITKIRKCYVQTIDEAQTREVLDQLRGKLPPKFIYRVAAIENPKNLTRTDTQTLRQWREGGVDILIAPSIPPHTRAPQTLEVIVLQPNTRSETLEPILVRALQPAASNATQKVTIVEITPCSNPEECGFRTIPMILGWGEGFAAIEQSEPAPAQTPVPAPPPEPPVAIEAPISPALTPSKKHHGRQATPLELITSAGVDLRTVPVHELALMIARLTPNLQQYVLSALESPTMTAPELAEKLGKNTPLVYASMYAALENMGRLPTQKSSRIEKNLSSPRSWILALADQSTPPLVSARVLHEWQRNGFDLPNEVTRGPDYKLRDRWAAYADTVRALERGAKEINSTPLLSVVSALFQDETSIPSLPELLTAVENYLGDLVVRVYIDTHSRTPMTAESIRKAIATQIIYHGAIAPIVKVLAQAAEAPYAKEIFGRRHPFSCYGGYSAEIAARLTSISRPFIKAALVTIRLVVNETPIQGIQLVNETPIQAIQRMAQPSKFTSPVSEFLRSCLTSDDPQKALEEKTGFTFPWPVIFLDLAPLCHHKPETLEQQKLFAQFEYMIQPTPISNR